MNKEIYELALKHLNALDANTLLDVELRHDESPQRDEDGIKQNRLCIDIYYNEPYETKNK